MSADDFGLVGDSAVSVADLALIGEAVLNLAGAVPLMRHTSPTGTIGYAEPSTGAQMLVNDFALWCSTSPHSAAAGARVLAYLERTGWLAQQVASLPTFDEVAS